MSEKKKREPHTAAKLSWAVTLVKAAEKELLALDERCQAVLIETFEFIKEAGTHAGSSVIKRIRDKIWEIRAHEGKMNQPLRALCWFRPGNVIEILRIFIKKTNKISKQEIATAKRRMKKSGG